MRNDLINIVTLNLVLSLALVAVPALADEPDTTHGMRLKDISQGTFLLKTCDSGAYLPAPIQSTEVQIVVRGVVARTRVTQRFENPSSEWVEGIYVFPLPTDAAVDWMHMVIGDYEIEGQIREHEEARKIYEEARDQGQATSLLEQWRPNIFTTSVANIAPGDRIEVVIEYQQTIKLNNGTYDLRFPMVVNPRYNPGASITSGEHATEGVSDTTRVPDADKIAPVVTDGPPINPVGQGRVVQGREQGRGAGGAANPVGQGRVVQGREQERGAGGAANPVGQGRVVQGREQERGAGGAVNPVTLSVSLDAGLPLAWLECPYHAVQTVPEGDTGYLIELEAGTVPADRDFVLEWAVEAVEETRTAVFVEELEGEYYVLLMAVPPATQQTSELRLPREMILIIDTSGSMEGEAIIQARDAVLFALDQLQADDWFNVISFNTELSLLFSESRQAFPAVVDEAREWVRGLDAGGGTEMLPALEAALLDRQQLGLVRQVVFATDGSVGNENELVRVIERDLGRSRLFTIGIGSAPNTSFMERSARFGRGTFTHIGSASEVGLRMEELFAKLSNPVMTNIELRWPDPAAEQWPQRLPDLYLGEPLVATARLATASGEVVISGFRDLEPWQMHLPLVVGAQHSGVHQLWARRKIETLMNQQVSSTNPDSIKAEVIKLALHHHLVSRYTSLVAVDVVQSRSAADLLVTSQMPVNLPHGRSFTSAFSTTVSESIMVSSTSFHVAGLALFVEDQLQRSTVGITGRDLRAVIDNEPGWSTALAGDKPTPYTGAGISGRTELSITGSTGVDNQYRVNGLVNTVPVTTPGFPQPVFDAIEEIQAQSAGLGAEVGRFAGGVVSIKTKSGGNDTRGSVDARWQGRGLIESGDSFDPDTDIVARRALSATVGGPIVLDKAWFFAAAAHSRDRSTPTASPVPQVNDRESWVATVTWHMSDSNWLELNTVNGTTRIDNDSASRFITAEAASLRETENEAVGLSWTSIFNDSLYMEMQAGFNRYDFDVTPISGDLSRSAILDLDSRVVHGNAAEIVHSRHSDRQWLTNLSYYIDDWLGSHEIKTGVDYRRDRTALTRAFTGGAWFQVSGIHDLLANPNGTGRTDIDGDGYQDHLLLALGDGAGQETSSVSDLWTAYVQDDIRLTSGLTAKVGLRLDTVGFSNDPGREIVTLRSLQPRLGISWDPFDSGRTMVRASWGRSMHPAALALAETVNNRAFGWSEWLGFESLCNDPSVTTDPYCDPAWLRANLALDGEERVTVDGNGNQHLWYLRARFGVDSYETAESLGGGRLQPPETETVALALTQELGLQTSLELGYLSKRARHLLADVCASNAWIWDSTVAAPDLGEPDTWPSVSGCTGFVLANIDQGRRDYHAYRIRLSNRNERLYMRASYTWESSTGNLSTDSVLAYASASYDLFPRDYLNLSGYLPDSRRHRVRVNGHATLPAELRLAFDLSWQSAPVLYPWSECSRVIAQGAAGLEAAGYDPLLLAACVQAGGSGTIFLDEHGASRGHSFTKLDLGLTRSFKLGSVTLEPILTVSNALGEEQPEAYLTEVFNPTWEHGQTTAWSKPRSYEIGFRIEF